MKIVRQYSGIIVFPLKCTKVTIKTLDELKRVSVNQSGGR